jgi:hypothetical protein
MVIEQSMTQLLRADAEDATPDGAATIRQTVESVAMQMNSPMFALAYDSARPEAAADPMSARIKEVLSPMIGASFTVVMAPTGEVLKVEGLTALAEKMFKAVAPDPAAAGMIDSLKANMSDDAMRSMLMQMFAQFPARPLKAGDTWNTQVTNTNPMLGGLVTTVTSTLKAIEPDGGVQIARVSTGLTIKQDASKPALPNPMGFVLKMAEGTGDGEQMFEAATGRLRRSTIRLTMPMSMSGTAPDGTAMDISTNVKTTTTVELVEK